MDPGSFKIIELFLVFGGILVWGGYELWSLNRYKQREREQAAKERAPSDPA